jgi:hypothetical protein
MKNRNLLLGAGVVIVGYLLWKNSQNVTKSDVAIPKTFEPKLNNNIKDLGNGLSVQYGDCNPITKKCDVIKVTQYNSKTNDTFSWYKEKGKYFASHSNPLIKTQPIEITEKQWIEKAITLLPI